MVKTFAGIGSREIPALTDVLLRHNAFKLADLGYTLRTGGATGTDQIFMDAFNSRGNMEVYLPWKNFEAEAMKPYARYITRHEAQIDAWDIASRFHPAWKNLSPGAKRLHARNVHQIYGPDVTTEESLADFVVCYTDLGKGGGGTGQALRIARHFGIPIYDFGTQSGFESFVEEILN